MIPNLDDFDLLKRGLEKIKKIIFPKCWLNSWWFSSHGIFVRKNEKNNLKKQTQHVPTWSSAELTRSVFGGAFFFGSMLVFGGAVYPRVLNQSHVVIFLPDFGTIKCTTRWAPTSSQWGEIIPISMVITPVTHLFLAIYKGYFTPFITGSGVHLVELLHKFGVI